MNAKIRAQAVLLLNALASRRTRSDGYTLGFMLMADELEVCDEAVSLARDCYDHIPSMSPMETPDGQPGSFELECAQAALLVEEGWDIGDSIVGDLSPTETNETAIQQVFN